MFLNNKTAHIEIDIWNLFFEHFVNSHRGLEPLYSNFLFDDLTLDSEITETGISNAISSSKDKVTI